MFLSSSDKRNSGSLVDEFNDSDTNDALIILLAQSPVVSPALVRFINSRIDHMRTVQLKFSVLKLSDDQIVYVNENAEIACSDTHLPAIKVVLGNIKSFCADNPKDENITYSMRTLILAASKGGLKSYDVYTTIDTDAAPLKALKQLLLYEKVWMGARAQLHNQIVESVLVDVRHLSELINETGKMNKGIYTVRGNVAAGKSTFVKKLLQKNIPILNNTDGVIGTDLIKRLLAKAIMSADGTQIAGYAFHDEAAMLSKRVLSAARQENLSYFIDQRMQSAEDLEALLVDAKNRNMPITIYDIKLDFMTSALRVLSRSGRYPSDPTPDFNALFKSYKAIEENRYQFIQEAKKSSLVKNIYTILFNSADIPPLVPIKRNFKVLQENIPVDAAVAQLIKPERIENVLLSNGKSVRSALDEHSRQVYRYKHTKEDYRHQIIDNIKNTSRTYDGKLDISASRDKRDKMNTSLSSREIRQTTRNNVNNTFKLIYNNKNIVIDSPQSLKRFIDEVALLVNHKLIRNPEHLIRSGHNSHRYNYINTKYVKEFYNRFVDELYDKISRIETDPIETAAWIEWNIDFSGHIFSDGCGRIAKFISSWLLMRSNNTLPDYVKGLGYASTVRESYRKRFALREKVGYHLPNVDGNYLHFLKYYKKLFNTKPGYVKILASGGLIYNHVNQFLIIQTTKGKDAGKWVIPGGKLEKDETPIKAFKREIFEETGLQVKKITLLGNRDYSAVSGNHYYFYDYSSEVINESKVRINEESSAFQWISEDQIGGYEFADSIRNFLNKYFIQNMTNYYKKVMLIDPDHLDTPNFDEHTMSRSLGVYVETKLPTKELGPYLSAVRKFEIHGIYPDLKILSELNLDFRILRTIHASVPKPFNSNSLRPIFLFAERNSEKFIVCCVTPGRDLLIHYASMINYYLKDKDLILSVYAYPDAEKKIDKWTGLDKTMIHENDVVILGYSTFFKVLFFGDSDFFVLSVNENIFYTSTRFITSSGIVVNCLEANYGHWGDIGDYLAQRICQLGAQEILHIGKVGTLTSPTELYKRIYIPFKFLVGRRSEIIDNGLNMSNSMEYIEEYSSLGHVSVSTTMEETFIQRGAFWASSIETIDIESSKIAQAVALYNLSKNKNVKFGAIHFSSDYLRTPTEINKRLEFDLVTEKTPEAYSKKDEILNEIFEIIKNHIMNNSVLPVRGNKADPHKRFKARG